MCKLPAYCYAFCQELRETVRIENNKKGFIRLTDGYEKLNYEVLNKQQGITKAEAAAMKMGSMFGWDSPAADPKNYNEYGKMK